MDAFVGNFTDCPASNTSDLVDSTEIAYYLVHFPDTTSAPYYDLTHIMELAAEALTPLSTRLPKYALIFHFLYVSRFSEVGGLLSGLSTCSIR